MNNNIKLNDGINFGVNNYMILAQQEEYMLNNLDIRANTLNNNPLVIEALDITKRLNTMYDGYMTTQMVADYFEVDVFTIEKTVNENMNELLMNGLVILRGNELNKYLKQYCISHRMSFLKTINLTLYNRSVVLNMAMILRDSIIAKAIRLIIIDVLNTNEIDSPVVQEYIQLKAELLKLQSRTNQLQIDQKLEYSYYNIMKELERLLIQENNILREKYIAALVERDRLRKHIDSIE